MDPDLLYALTVAVLAAKPELARELDDARPFGAERIVSASFVEIFGQGLSRMLRFSKDLHGPHKSEGAIGEYISHLDVMYIQMGSRYFRITGVSRLEQVGGIADEPANTD